MVIFNSYASHYQRVHVDQPSLPWLQPLGHARVSRYELLMLWRRLDADGSGEARWREELAGKRYQVIPGYPLVI